MCMDVGLVKDFVVVFCDRCFDVGNVGVVEIDFYFKEFLIFCLYMLYFNFWKFQVNCI